MSTRGSNDCLFEAPPSPDLAAIGDLRWPNDPTQIPDWLFTDERIYELERDRIFRGPTWSFVGLEAELPKGGDYMCAGFVARLAG